MTNETDDTLARYEAALRQIGTPTHVPKDFDPTDWWQHTACQRAQTARDALGIDAETLTRSTREEATPNTPATDAAPSAGQTVSDTSSRA